MGCGGGGEGGCCTNGSAVCTSFLQHCVEQTYLEYVQRTDQVQNTNKQEQKVLDSYILAYVTDQGMISEFFHSLTMKAVLNGNHSEN